MFGGTLGPQDNAFGMDGLRELQRQARAITAGLAQVGGSDARVEGWDTSRTVRVAMDGSGRLVDVAVGSGWRDTIEPADLGAAVIDAVNAAEAQRMDAW